eukprot:6176107-Pleurochrysis_carterae.AAC.4
MFTLCVDEHVLSAQSSHASLAADCGFESPPQSELLDDDLPRSCKVSEHILEMTWAWLLGEPLNASCRPDGWGAHVPAHVRALATMRTARPGPSNPRAAFEAASGDGAKAELKRRASKLKRQTQKHRVLRERKNVSGKKRLLRSLATRTREARARTA